jgi:hypothetical protein
VKGLLCPVERVRYISCALSRLARRAEVNVAIRAIRTVGAPPYSYLPLNLKLGTASVWNFVGQRSRTVRICNMFCCSLR